MAAAEDSSSGPPAEGSGEHTEADAGSDGTIPIQDKPEAAKLLILDVKTRWSSTHQMLRRCRYLKLLYSTSGHLMYACLERALEYIKAIQMFVRIAPKDAKLEELSGTEWDAIARIAEWLDSFREATTLMSMTKGLTLSSVLSIFRDLQDDIREAYCELPISAPPVLKQGLLNAHRKLSDYHYLTDATPYYIWASRKPPFYLFVHKYQETECIHQSLTPGSPCRVSFVTSHRTTMQIVRYNTFGAAGNS